MKVMIYADWMTFRQSLRSLLFVIVIYTATAMLWNGPLFFNLIVTVLSIITPTTLFSADRSVGWDRFSLALPVTRRDVVASKFAVGAIVNLGLLAVSGGLMLVYGLMNPHTTEQIAEMTAGLLGSEAAALAMMGLMMLIAFKFGIEKSRYIMMGCIFIPVAAGMLLSRVAGIGDKMQAALAWLSDLLSHHAGFFLLGMVVLGVAVYVICYRISVHIYQKTEL